MRDACVDVFLPPDDAGEEHGSVRRAFGLARVSMRAITLYAVSMGRGVFPQRKSYTEENALV